MTPCAAGEYQPNVGQAACSQCPVGNMCPTTGMSVVTPCATGTYQNSTGQTECLPCPEGRPSNSFCLWECLNKKTGIYLPRIKLNMFLMFEATGMCFSEMILGRRFFIYDRTLLTVHPIFRNYT